MNYTFDIYGRFSGTSDTPTDRSTEVAPDELTPDWNWNGVNWVFAPNILTVPITSVPITEPKRILTRLAFRNRFTEAEKVAIYTAANVETAIRVWLDDLAVAEEVDLDHPATVAGVNALEAAGLIGEGRAGEILE